MLELLFVTLEKEEKLLDEMINLAKQQQDALVSYNQSRINTVTKLQESLSNELKAIEDERIEMLMNWLELDRKNAMAIRLSMIESKLKGESLTRMKEYRKRMGSKVSELSQTNRNNQILAARAKRNNNSMMSLFATEDNKVCNVVV
ncbi:MAG: hypothetical protein Kapaf2KO_17030 [Candidatus Kapaibacteriales bacterium]